MSRAWCRIVVAWELCWYRYEVDLDDEDAEVRVLAQGTELGEIAHEDRQVNAVVDEHGALSLSGALTAIALAYLRSRSKIGAR